jgi:hypothetical protein
MLLSIFLKKHPHKSSGTYIKYCYRCNHVTSSDGHQVGIIVEKKLTNVRFEVFIVVKIQSEVFWVVILCYLNGEILPCIQNQCLGKPV